MNTSMNVFTDAATSRSKPNEALAPTATDSAPRAGILGRGHPCRARADAVSGRRPLTASLQSNPADADAADVPTASSNPEPRDPAELSVIIRFAAAGLRAAGEFC